MRPDTEIAAALAVIQARRPYLTDREAWGITSRTVNDVYWSGVLSALEFTLGDECNRVAQKVASLLAGESGLELHTVERGETVLENWLTSNWPAKTAEESRANPYG